MIVNQINLHGAKNPTIKTASCHLICFLFIFSSFLSFQQSDFTAFLLHICTFSLNNTTDSCPRVLEQPCRFVSQISAIYTDSTSLTSQCSDAKSSALSDIINISFSLAFPYYLLLYKSYFKAPFKNLPFTLIAQSLNIIIVKVVRKKCFLTLTSHLNQHNLLSIFPLQQYW